MRADGSFDDATMLRPPTYTPGRERHRHTFSVVLTLTGSGNGTCCRPRSNDSMTPTTNDPQPVVPTPAPDEEICQEGYARFFSFTVSRQARSVSTSALLWHAQRSGTEPSVTRCILLPVCTVQSRCERHRQRLRSTLTLRGAGSNGSCTAPVNDSMTLTITPEPVVGAGSDEEICQGGTHDLSNSGTVPTESGTSSLLWSSAGDGSFDDATMLAPTYTPGVNDIANGSVVLTLTGSGNGSCGPVNDSMTLTITPRAHCGRRLRRGDMPGGYARFFELPVSVPSGNRTQAALLWQHRRETEPSVTTNIHVGTVHTHPGANDIANGSP